MTRPRRPSARPSEKVLVMYKCEILDFTFQQVHADAVLLICIIEFMKYYQETYARFTE